MSPPVGRPPLSDEHETVRLNLRVPRDLDERLRDRAEADEATLSQAARDALERGLEA